MTHCDHMIGLSVNTSSVIFLRESDPLTSDQHFHQFKFCPDCGMRLIIDLITFDEEPLFINSIMQAQKDIRHLSIILRSTIADSCPIDDEALNRAKEAQRILSEIITRK